MSLRGEPVIEHATLADGRELDVRVAVAEDPYVDIGELSTVTAELIEAATPIAMVTTPLDPDETSEARELARAIKAGLERGDVEPDSEGVQDVVDEVLL